MITVNQAIGKIQQAYEIPIAQNTETQNSFPNNGLYVLHGKNSSGKSTVLKSLGGHLGRNEKVLYIPTERIGINVSTSTVVSSLDAIANEFLGHVGGQSLLPELWRSYSEKLATALFSQNEVLQKTDFQRRIKDLFNFDIRSAATRWVNQNNIELSADGSGIKAVHFIIAALATEEFSTIIIDEPELCLEPRVQKALYQLLVEKAATTKIFIATHSPHFINRQEPKHNFIVEINASIPIFEVPQTDIELYEKIIIDKLGFSISDVFLPEKIVIVEGECDRVILNAILNAKNISNAFVHKIGGISNYENIEVRVQAIEESVSPHLRGDELYLYKGKVALLTDYLNPNEDSQNKLRLELIRCFNDYWYQITDEESTGADILLAIPEECYSAASMSKTDYIDELGSLIARGSTYGVILSYKNEIAKKIAAAIEPDNVSSLLAVSGITKIIDFIQS